LIDVLFEDNFIVAVNKRAGIPIHQTMDPARPHLHGLVEKQLGQKLVLFHRLDVDTTGLVLLGKDPSINGAMTDLFHDRKIEKKYLCVVDGRWLPEWKQSVSYIKQGKAKGRWISADKGKFKERAETHFKLLDSCGDKSLVEATLQTGRTHQIRLHCLDRAHPILGDRLYLKPHPQGVPLALHARSLKFLHPKTKKELYMEAPLPDYWEEHWLPGLNFKKDLNSKG